MNGDELAAARAKHIAGLQVLRSALVPYLSSADEKQRRGASSRLRRVDARIRAMGGSPDEAPEDEGDELVESLIGPAHAPGRRHLLYG